jgi:hypothetical protein
VKILDLLSFSNANQFRLIANRSLGCRLLKDPAGRVAGFALHIELMAEPVELLINDGLVCFDGGRREERGHS